MHHGLALCIRPGEPDMPYRERALVTLTACAALCFAAENAALACGASYTRAELIWPRRDGTAGPDTVIWLSVGLYGRDRLEDIAFHLDDEDDMPVEFDLTPIATGGSYPTSHLVTLTPKAPLEQGQGYKFWAYNDDESANVSPGREFQIQEMGSTPTLTEPSIREVEIQDPADLSYPCGRISDHRMAYILHIDGIPETHPLRYRLDMELPDGKVISNHGFLRTPPYQTVAIAHVPPDEALPECLTLHIMDPWGNSVTLPKQCDLPELPPEEKKALIPRISDGESGCSTSPGERPPTPSPWFWLLAMTIGVASRRKTKRV